MERFRERYKEKVIVKIATVILVVLSAMAVMLPIMKLAELFGIDLRKNNGTNLKVDLPNVIFFFLFVTCSTLVIWAAQKFIHKAQLLDLGFRTKIFKLLLIGFLFGAIQSGTGYVIMALNATSVTYASTIPPDVSIWSYAIYYVYFIFGFLTLNSYIEELVSRAYPTERLKAHINPHIIFIIMGIIFTAGHFFTRDFSIGYSLSLFTYSYTLSLLYYYSNSIWLVIGVHSGINWVSFSFFGTNWQLGALVHIEISGMPSWVASYTPSIIGVLCLLGIAYFRKKGGFKKLSSSS